MFFYFLFFSLFLSSFSANAQTFANSQNNELNFEYHIVKEGETLHDIAAKHAVGFDELLNANPAIENGNIIYVDQKLILPTIHLVPDAKHEGIIINLAELRLYFFEGDIARSFPISIGSDERTPTGITKIIDKKKDPSWRPPLAIRLKKPNLPEIMPPGPENPIGKFALYLDSRNDIKWLGISLHGTDNPSSIGSRVSLGCMRLYPQDIEELFNLIPIGTEVNVLSQDIKIEKINKKIYFESHFRNTPDLVLEGWRIEEEICKKIKNCEKEIDWNKVDEAAVRNLGIPEDVSYTAIPKIN